MFQLNSLRREGLITEPERHAIRERALREALDGQPPADGPRRPAALSARSCAGDRGRSGRSPRAGRSWAGDGANHRETEAIPITPTSPVSSCAHPPGQYEHQHV